MPRCYKNALAVCALAALSISRTQAQATWANQTTGQWDVQGNGSNVVTVQRSQVYTDPDPNQIPYIGSGTDAQTHGQANYTNPALVARGNAGNFQSSVFWGANGSSAGVDTNVGWNITYTFSKPLNFSNEIFIWDLGASAFFFENSNTVYTVTATLGGNRVSTSGWTLATYAPYSSAQDATTFNGATGVLSSVAGPTSAYDVLTPNNAYDTINFTGTTFRYDFFGIGFDHYPVNAVPEPGSIALLAALGLAGSGLLLRRRSSRA